MRNALLLSLLAAALAGAAPDGAAAQGQPAPAPKPTQQPVPAPKPAPPATTAPKPAQPAQPAPGGQATTPTPRRPAAAPAATRGGIALTVTDPSGATIPGVRIASDGPTPRNGETNASGQANFPGLLAGVYRLRFESDAVVAFEKEVSVRNGQVLAVDVMLNPAKKVAPPPAPAPVAAPPPVAAAAPVGPLGQLQVLSLVDLAEKELERKQPRRETLVSCSASTRSTLLQLNQDQPQRMYENAESLLYVIAGEGVLRVSDKETRMVAGSFAAIPRHTPFVVARRGRNPVIFLSVLSGEPCDSPK